MPNLAPSILSHPCAAVSALPVFFLGCQPQWPDALDRNGCLTSPVSDPSAFRILSCSFSQIMPEPFFGDSGSYLFPRPLRSSQVLSAASRQGSISVTAGIWQGRSRVWVLRWLRVV